MAFQTRILKYYFILIGVYTNYNKNKNNPLQTAKPKILFKKWKNTKKYEKNNTIHNGCWRSGPEVFLREDPREWKWMFQGWPNGNSIAIYPIKIIPTLSTIDEYSKNDYNFHHLK